MDGFRFWNMSEVRLFLKYITEKTHTPLINDAVWEEAKQRTYKTYSTSESLHYLQRCIQLFEQVNRAKYLTDFKEYVFESSIEDFCEFTGGDVVVSTIHKSKGREFDDVYMLLSAPPHITDDLFRRYYVGITRAKQRLFIHTNTSIFDRIPADQKYIDNNQYGMPNEIVLQLSHKDVNLSFFKSRKKEILSLRAGQKLLFNNNYLFNPYTNNPVGQLSQKMQKELTVWKEKLYNVTDVTIRFIVAWKPQEAPKEEPEYAVLLVDLRLNKTGSTHK